MPKKKRRKRKWKKGTYHYIVLDRGRRKRFKKGDYPGYEPSSHIWGDDLF